MSTDLRALHARALADASGLVHAIEPGRLGAATPCGDWDLGELLDHMVGQNHGFAEAVEVGDAPVSAYAGPGRERAIAGWPASVERLTAAFAGADLDGLIRLVEISPELRFGVSVALGFQLLDTVVHAWDVATASGQDYRPEEELLAATYAIARRVPGGDARTRPGAAFGPELTIASAGDRWIDTLARLGRAPH